MTTGVDELKALLEKGARLTGDEVMRYIALRDELLPALIASAEREAKLQEAAVEFLAVSDVDYNNLTPDQYAAFQARYDAAEVTLRQVLNSNSSAGDSGVLGSRRSLESAGGDTQAKRPDDTDPRAAGPDTAPTPRTDAQQQAADEAFDVAGLVPANFARQLERALADTECVRDTWRRQCEERDKDLVIVRQKLKAEREAREEANAQTSTALHQRNDESRLRQCAERAYASERKAREEAEKRVKELAEAGAIRYAELKAAESRAKKAEREAVAVAQALEQAAKDWYSYIPVNNRFSANFDGGIDQDDNGPWVLKSDVDAAIRDSAPAISAEARRVTEGRA